MKPIATIVLNDESKGFSPKIKDKALSALLVNII